MPTHINTAEDLNKAVDSLTRTIQVMIEATVPKSKSMPFSKRWWTHELRRSKQEMRRIGQATYINRSQRTHPIHAQYQHARNDYSALIKITKRRHWESWLEGVTEDSVWTANNLVTRPPTDGGKVRVPDLHTRDANGHPRTVRDNMEKGELLYRAFFPLPDASDTHPLDPDYPPPAFAFEEVSDTQIHRAIAKLSPYKAPGPSGIPNAVITKCRDVLVPFLGPIYRATFALGVYPTAWKVTSTIALPKPGKPDYLLAKALPDSTGGMPSQGALLMCSRNPHASQHTTPSVTSNTFWGTTWLISDRCNTSGGQVHQGRMA